MASVLLGLGLSGCGQKGDLYLPNDDDFKQRATLPDIVRRQFPSMPPPRQPGSTNEATPSTPDDTKRTAPAASTTPAVAPPSR